MGHLKGEIGTSMTTFRITKEMRKRASSGKYSLSKDERAEAKIQTKKNRAKIEQDKKIRNQVHHTTFAKLSAALDTNVTPELIKICRERYRNIGNGRYRIKCIDPEALIIKIKPQKGVALTMKIIE